MSYCIPSNSGISTVHVIPDLCLQTLSYLQSSEPGRDFRDWQHILVRVTLSLLLVSCQPCNVVNNMQ